MVRLTLKKLNDFIKDELKAVKEYERYGLYDLALDESKHARFLKEIRARMVSMKSVELT